MKPSNKATCGQSRTSASQAVSRGFDSPLPLQSTTYKQNNGVVSVRQNRYAVGAHLAVLFCPAPNGKVFGVTIDRADLERVLAAGFWCVHNFHSGRKNSHHFALYAFRNKKGGGAELLHRFLLDAPKGILVDHSKQRTLDNRRSCSIRLATRSQNAMNGRTRKDSLTGYRGVTPDPDSGTFRARIRAEGKRLHLQTKELHKVSRPGQPQIGPSLPRPSGPFPWAPDEDELEALYAEQAGQL